MDLEDMDVLNLVRIIFLFVEATSSSRTIWPTNKFACPKLFSRSYVINLWWKREPNFCFPDLALHLSIIFCPSFCLQSFRCFFKFVRQYLYFYSIYTYFFFTSICYLRVFHPNSELGGFAKIVPSEELQRQGMCFV